MPELFGPRDKTRDRRSCDVCGIAKPWIPDVDEATRRLLPSMTKAEKAPLLGKFTCAECKEQIKAVEKSMKKYERRAVKGTAITADLHTTGEAVSHGNVPSSSSAYRVSSTFQELSVSGTGQPSSQAGTTSGSTAHSPYVVDDSEEEVCTSPEEASGLDAYAPSKVGSASGSRVYGAAPAAQASAPKQSRRTSSGDNQRASKRGRRTEN